MAAIVCQCIGKLCSECTRCLSVPCHAICGTVGQALCSPFFPYLALTCGLNLPPTIWAIQDAVRYYPDKCRNSWWLWINAIGTLANLLGAFYIASQIQMDETLPATTTTPVTPVVEAQAMAVESSNTTGKHKSVPQAQAYSYYRSIENTNGTFQSFTFMSTNISRDLDGSPNSFLRLGHVLCFDYGVAVYIVVAIFWMIWQSVGFSRLVFGGAHGANESADCQQVNQWAVHSIILGFCYMMMVCVAFACSLCCLRR